MPDGDHAHPSTGSAHDAAAEAGAVAPTSPSDDGSSPDPVGAGSAGGPPAPWASPAAFSSLPLAPAPAPSLDAPWSAPPAGAPRAAARAGRLTANERDRLPPDRRELAVARRWLAARAVAALGLAAFSLYLVVAGGLGRLDAPPPKPPGGKVVAVHVVGRGGGRVVVRRHGHDQAYPEALPFDASRHDEGRHAGVFLAVDDRGRATALADAPAHWPVEVVLGALGAALMVPVAIAGAVRVLRTARLRAESPWVAAQGRAYRQSRRDRRATRDLGMFAYQRVRGRPGHTARRSLVTEAPTKAEFRLLQGSLHQLNQGNLWVVGGEEPRVIYCRRARRFAFVRLIGLPTRA